MKKYIFSAIALLCFTITMTGQTSKTVRFKVIETSDVHGHFFPYNFMEQKSMKGTLVRANTYINKERDKFGKQNLLLIDNGDILQGQPCIYWSNYVMPENENLAARVINYMNYDAETVGNHDIEPGHQVYDKWIREVRCPLLGANIVKEGSDGKANPKNIYTGLQPYSIHYIDGVKIAVIGMLTPAIPNWLNKSIWKGIEFEEMTSCAKKWIKYLKEVERPDLIFGLFHSGKDGGIVTPDYEENATAAVAKEVPGFDIIFFGHDHQVHNEWITNKDGQQVLIIDPSCWVQNIAEAVIELTYENGKLTKKDIKGEIVSVKDEEIDEQMMSYFQKDIDNVKAYVSEKIGYFENPIYTRESFFGNAAFTDLIHNLQLQITKADISFNAPLSFNTTINAGDVTMADIQYGDGVGTDHLVERHLNGLQQFQMLVFLDILNQLHQHLRVGIADEVYALGLQLRLQVGVVLDDAVVDDGQVLRLRVVRVSVPAGGLAVGGPACVGDAYGTAHVLVGTILRQVVHLALRLIHVQVAASVQQRHAGTVIATILQPSEALDQDGISILLSNISYDSTHNVSLYFSTL